MSEDCCDVVVDWEYELQMKDEKIKELNDQIKYLNSDEYIVTRRTIKFHERVENIVRKKITEMLNTERDYFHEGLTVEKYDRSGTVLITFMKSNNNYFISYDGLRMYYSYYMTNLRTIEEEYLHHRARNNNDVHQLITRPYNIFYDY
jgi:hypothetical protein